MNQFKRYTSMNKIVLDKIKQCNHRETINHIVNFLEEKNEKYTYNSETDKYYISSFYPTFPSKAWNRMVKGIRKIVKHDRRVPLQVDLVITGNCHCNCWHCFRSKYELRDLSLEKIKECIESLYKMGTSTVGITGGEPMLRKDILNIIEMIPDGMEGQLYTTGHRIDEEFASKIKDTNLTRCIISLDHFDEKVVCKLRNNPHAFEEALNAIKVLTEQNIYTSVTVCITDELLNPGYLQKYFDFVGNLGVQEIRVVMQIPQGNLEDRSVGKIYAQAIGMVREMKMKYDSSEDYPAIVNFCEYESPDYFGCGAGSNYISINNDGLVTPCVAVPLSFGNVYEDTLENIYEKMGEYFPRSDRFCYGIASSRVISRDNIDTTVTPLSIDVSKNIAMQCKISTKRAAFFEHCAQDEEIRD